MGTDVEGKMAAALRRIGFDKVFDTNFSADLTIMEEAHEFLDRVKNKGSPSAYDVMLTRMGKNIASITIRISSIIFQAANHRSRCSERLRKHIMRKR